MANKLRVEYQKHFAKIQEILMESGIVGELQKPYPDPLAGEDDRKRGFDGRNVSIDVHQSTIDDAIHSAATATSRAAIIEKQTREARLNAEFIQQDIAASATRAYKK